MLKLPLRTALMKLALPALAILVGSCQNSSSTAPDSVPQDNGETYTAEIAGLPGDWAIPDSVQWSVKNTPSQAQLVVAGLEVRVTAHLGSAPTDTVHIGLWRIGLRLGTWHFRHRGSKDLVFAGMETEPLAMEMLRRAGKNPTPEAVRAQLVKALVESDPFLSVHPFSQNVPEGMDSVAVLRAFAIAVSASGQSFAQILRSPTLPMDSLALRAFIRSLAASGDIPDTTKIFGGPQVPNDSTLVPPDTTRPNDSTLVPPDTTKPNDSTLVPPDTTKPNDSTLVPPDTTRPNDSTLVPPDTTRPNDSTLVPPDTTRPNDSTLVPPDTTRPNDSTLVPPDTTRPNDSTLVPPDTTRPNDSTLVPPDTTKPNIDMPPSVRRLSPARDTTVDVRTSLLRVAWRVSDDAGLWSVTIGGQPVEGSDSIYARLIPLAFGENVIVLVATDSLAKSTRDTLRVKRYDTIPPAIVRTIGTKDTTVSFTTSKIAMSWRVIDNHGLRSVTINGIPVSGVSGTYSRTIDLASGTNRIAISAIDSIGLSSTDTVTVIRQGDTIAPRIVRLTGTQDTSVSPAITKLSVTWKVTDNHALRSVVIRGVAVSGDSGTYSSTIDLAYGTNRIGIFATDSSGLSSTDTITVVRLRDTIPPSIVRQTGTSPQPVSFATSKIEVSWKVADQHGLHSVTINGVVVSSTSGIYSRTLDLVVGSNQVQIVASDMFGLRSTDSFTVVRLRDTIPPVIVIDDTLTRDRSVSYDTKTYTISWKVTDNDALASVRINGSLVVGTANVFRSTLNLEIGANKVHVVATDSSGNTKRDSVTITRSKPDTLLASWDFTTPSSTVVDLTGNGFDLTQEAAGIWNRANTPEFTPSYTGKTLIKARVWLDRYPSSSNYNGVATIAGYNEGLKLLVSEYGQVMAVGQKGNGSSWTWFGSRTKAGAVPLGRWVELAVGADNSTASMGIWIDGVAQESYSHVAVAGTQIRSATSNPFYIGKDFLDNQKFAGKIQSLKVYSDYVLGAAKPWTVDSCITMQCKLPDRPVASWTIPNDTITTLNSAYNGLTLTKATTGVWRRPGADTLLLPSLPTGQVLYRATVLVDSYPTAVTYNRMQVVMGFYEGMKMGITSRGQIHVGGQRVLDGGTNAWYAVRTVDNAVPLNRQVTIDVGADQASGEFFIWIDGVRQRTWTPSLVPGQKIRVAATRFTVGNDGIDAQKFTGKIYSVSVYNRFINGYGLNPEIDPTIDD